MSTKHLHNEARGYQPERGKGVPKQTVRACRSRSGRYGAAEAGAGLTR